MYSTKILLLSIVLVVLPSISRTHAAECGIYLAESTIPGAGMGMFVGNRAFQKGDVLTDSDLMVPVFELDWHNGHNEDYHFLWNDYVWSATMFWGMDQEVEDMDHIHVCSGGMGAAINCMLPLVNAEDEVDSYRLGTSGVSSQSPGAGAFTPYYGRKFVATAPLEPGTELYIDYGENYFQTRDAYKSVPLSENYQQADQLLKKFQEVVSRQTTTTATSESDAVTLQMDLWDLINDQPLGKQSRTMFALPTNATQVDTVLNSGGTANMHYNHSIRTIDWLEKHGQCMDNIKDGVSTIPHAGRGAFSNRFIPQGGLVAPAPLIHIPDRDVLTMYDSYQGEDGIYRDSEKPIHAQLLLNYCYGHEQSTLLLCPYGLLTALINHASSSASASSSSKQSKHQQTANTKIVWSQSMRHPEWRNQTLPRWSRQQHSGLTFDFVALRDIEEDEEILVDYGDEWEQAWQAHAQSFDAPRRNYMPAFELNKMTELQVRTMDEWSYEDQGVFLFCRQTFLKRQGLEVVEAADVYDEYEGAVPCRVRFRWNDDSYVAETFIRGFVTSITGEDDIPKDTLDKVLFDLPRDAFFFNDGPYYRDHHQDWSFRHGMRIPDELFPEAWKNMIVEPEKDDDESNDVCADGATCASAY